MYNFSLSAVFFVQIFYQFILRELIVLTYFKCSIPKVLGNMHYLIASLYRSLSSSCISFLDCFRTNKCDNYQIVLSGDFSIDLLTKNTYSTKLKNILVNTGVQNIIAECTRPNKNGGGTLIDLFIRNNASVSVEVFKTQIISDHLML